MPLSLATQQKLRSALARSPRIEALDIGPNCLKNAGPLLERHFQAKRTFVVADENTFAAAGPATMASLAQTGIHARTLIFPAAPMPKPDQDAAQQIADALQPDEIFLVIGSGVLNDLVKFAAFSSGTPYMCVATAASMDGYTSAGAPLTVDGFKKTLTCQAPRVVLADLDVIADAPEEMAGWGYADLAGKKPAGADWILADALGVEPIDEVAWSLVQADLGGWLETADRVGHAEKGAIAELFAGLALVGFAMEEHGSSRPASGADHQIAHLWEMEGLARKGKKVSHGACVAIGSLAVLALYDWLMAQDLTKLDVEKAVARQETEAETNQAIRALFPDPAMAAKAQAETAAKTSSTDKLAKRLETLSTTWPALREKLQAHLPPTGRFVSRLKAAGAPASPEEIGVTYEQLRMKIHAARYFRSRYTVLDVLAETGLMDAALTAAFPQQ